MAMNPRLMRPRASGFNPRTLSGLVLWLDPTDATSYTVSTGVSEWRDKSGGSVAFTQTTGNSQPTLSTINGKTAFSFDGSNDSLATSSTIFTSNSSFTFFQVILVTFPGTSGHVFNHRTGAGGVDTNDFCVALNANQGATWIFGTLRTRVRSFRSGVGYNADQRFDSVDASGAGAVSVTGTFSASSATSTAWWRGTASPTSSSTSDTGTNAGMAIGCRLNATRDLFYQGLMGEILAYSRTLTTTERRSVESYLAKKWGYATS